MFFNDLKSCVMYLLQISAAVVLVNLLFLFIKLHPVPCQPFITRKEVTRVSEAQTEGINKKVVHTKYTEI